MRGPEAARQLARIYRCPVCGQDLRPDSNALVCTQGHSFDMARQGYVNLLLAQQKNSRDPGYSRAMIDARAHFLSTGHYDQLADALADVVLETTTGDGGTILDAGCGEGYYLRHLARRVTDDLDVELAGVDISKHAILAAARADSMSAYAVGSTFALPVGTGTVQSVLVHFSPVSPAEFARVLSPGGSILVGSPGPRHLHSLRTLLYDVVTPSETPEELGGHPAIEQVGQRRIHYTIRLTGAAELTSLLEMTPYAWTARSPKAKAKIAELDSFETEVDVLLHEYVRH